MLFLSIVCFIFEILKFELLPMSYQPLLRKIIELLTYRKFQTDKLVLKKIILKKHEA